ncbi:protein fluG [Periconia macrospinosa]|uniref:Protein fluG n=1 Tax=Periconia macrospinosa TaxID=97972 RepID=A0A2V1DRK1_9PLEO|nr:protein fluG [Periconia macrospinosa]
MTERDAQRLDAFLADHSSINYIHLQWLDYSAILRTQIVPLHIAKDLASGSLDPFTLGEGCMVIPVSTDPKYFADGPEVWELHPDWASLIPFVSGEGDGEHARVNITRCCPRQLFKSVLQSFQEANSTTILLGFEIEFSLLSATLSSPAVNPLDPNPGHSSTSGLRNPSRLSLLTSIATSLHASGIPVRKFHTEGVEQYEIALCPKPALEAIDALLHAHETIRRHALAANLQATFAVHPLLNNHPISFNSCHIHLSLNPPPENPSVTNAFLAGIMRKLSALCALGMPNFDSYSCVQTMYASWIGFGTQNRHLPVRKIAQNRWELRFVDATANMYLVVALVLMSGGEGMREERVLVHRDMEEVYPGEMSEEELAAFGVVKRLPRDLEDAVAQLKKDVQVRAWMGEEMFGRFVGVKEVECRYFGEMTVEERRLKFVRAF